MISDNKKEAIKAAADTGSDAILEVFLYSARIKDWDTVIYMAQAHNGDFSMFVEQAVALIGDMAAQLKVATKEFYIDAA